ncbi:MAG: hypothetical protein LBJ10_02525 [Clostridiales bacterium]|jgi:alpha-galactosidase|nr:hypothetical protein [Clostridiales bacterium]
MSEPNIVFIGAGSLSFGIPTFGDLFTSPELAGATLSLVDIDPDNLERMYQLALRMNEASGLNFRVRKTANRREVLPGAGYVICSLAIERCELWKQDFRIPLAHGIRHSLGENGGPGALFFSLRTIPLILDICRDMEELCPDAWFLNFSNPESRIVLAVNKYTRIRCVGMCHGIFMSRGDIALVLGRKPESIEVCGAGLNHFQWITSVRDAESREDLYPLLRAAEASHDPGFRPLTRKLFRAFGYWPTCSDDHLGEYLPYGYEAGMEGYDFDADERARAQTRLEVDAVLAGRADARDWLKKSGEKAVEALVALHTGERRYIPSAIVYNQGAIPDLPAELAVEVPILVDRDGAHRVPVDLPLELTALLAAPAASQRLAVEAAVTGDKQAALRALLADPAVDSTEAAAGLLDELWEINKPYIHGIG